MLKKTITFEDLDGNQVTEDFYFNINKTELIQMQLSVEGGMEARLSQIVASQDGKRIMEIVDDILRQAYGVRSDDNRRFLKSDELFEDFKQTDAYNVLFLELCTDAGASAAFMNALMPKDLAAEVEAKLMTKPVQDNALPEPKAIRDMTTEELQAAYMAKMRETVEGK